ncbi:DinB family protein [Chloroflexota bacterium]
MTHPRVDLFRFTRKEWLRGLEGIPEKDGTKHFGQMNCISWIVGHLAWHEQSYWIERAQGNTPFPHLNEQFAFRSPMSSPSLREVLETWHTITRQVDDYMDRLTTFSLKMPLLREGKDVGQTIGSGIQRITFHYWYHIGEIQAIRQLLEHANLPDFVGDIEELAPYRPE